MCRERYNGKTNSPLLSFELRTETKRFNPKAEEFRPKNIVAKPKRKTQEIAKALIQHLAEEHSHKV